MSHIHNTDALKDQWAARADSLPKPYYREAGITIYCGDCREILPLLPEKSVDLVLTDPPYLSEFLWAYSTLSKESARLLSVERFLFAYGAIEHVRNILSRLDEHLIFWWVHVLVHTGGYPRMWCKRIMSGYKPVFMYANGPPEDPPWIASLHTDEMDKRFHEWGQGGKFAMKVVAMFASVAGVVLDPFTGAGPVLVACKQLGRQGIGIEICEKYCEIAANRLRQAVLQFEPPPPEQGALL